MAKRPDLLTVRQLLSIKDDARLVSRFFVPRRDRVRFTTGISAVDPSELRSPGGVVVKYTPWPDGDQVDVVCPSPDIDTVCLPIMKRTPAGLVFTKCDCWRVGDVSLGSPPGGPPPETTCRLTLTPTGWNCGGRCRTLGHRCRRIGAIIGASLVFTCKCGPVLEGPIPIQWP